MTRHIAYCCPLCRRILDQAPGRYVCEAGHSFDVAREGYVNLLPVQHKHSREPGDNAEMISARRRFLEAGYYAPLAEALLRLIQALGPVEALLDIGCGEGWYCGRLQAGLSETEVHGIDISKPAIRLAARRYPACRFAVAGSHALPFGDAVFTLALNVFAPLAPDELRRVIRPGGRLLRVSAAPDHLFALKRLLYEQPRRHGHESFQLQGFALESQERLQAPLRIDSTPALRDLIQMTPYAWKLQGNLNLSEIIPFEAGLDVWLSVYRRA